MKTLQLGLEWFPERGGGLDRFYFDLVRALPDVGVECRGLVAGSGRAAVESGGRVRAFAEPTAPPLARWNGVRRAVRDILRSAPVDLVAAHFALHAFPVRRIIGSVPLVVHFQGPWADESRLEGDGRFACMAKSAVERAVYSRARRLIVLSHAFKKILSERYAVPEERIRVVPGGVDTARFDGPLSRQAARETFGWPVDRPIVLTVRRLVKRVGLEGLIEAALKIRASVPDVLILIAGRGALQAALQQQINDNNLQNNVRLLGFVPDADLPAAYRAADISVVPTVALEGFGLVVAESLAAGTPALVTPVGSLPEVVRGLSESLIFCDAGPDAVAEGITRALRNDSCMPTADACRRYAAEHFDWKVIASRVKNVYMEALNN